MTNELQEKVRDWIGVSGFGLELRAAREFLRHGFNVVQSDYYRDPKTDDLREIDIVLFEGEGAVSRDRAAVVILVECKRAVDKPWLILASLRQLPPRIGVEQRAATGRADHYLPLVSGNEDLWRSELFRLSQPLGFSLVVATLDRKEHDSSGDRAYKALSGVTAAASAKLRQIQSAVNEAVVIAWPLILIEGPLFQAWLNEQGELVVERVEQGVIAWRNPRLAFHSFVTVVTEVGLPQLAKNLRADITSFVELVTAEMKVR